MDGSGGHFRYMVPHPGTKQDCCSMQFLGLWGHREIDGQGGEMGGLGGVRWLVSEGVCGV